MRFTRRLGSLTGWKTFAFEVMIVVVGVIIAIYANNLAANSVRKHEMRQTMRAVETDLLNFLLLMTERTSLEPCRLEQESALLAKLQEEGDHWEGYTQSELNEGNTLTVLPMVLRMPLRVMTSSGWQAATENDSAVYLDRDLYNSLNYVFETVDFLLARRDEIWRLKGRLSQLAIGGPISPEQRRDAIALLGEISALEGAYYINGLQMRNLIVSQIDFRTDAAARFLGESPEEFANLLKQTVETVRSVYGACVAPTEYQPAVDLFERLTGEKVDTGFLTQGDEVAE